jgi:hypothetical protein
MRNRNPTAGEKMISTDPISSNFNRKPKIFADSTVAREGRLQGAT